MDFTETLANSIGSLASNLNKISAWNHPFNMRFKVIPISSF